MPDNPLDKENLSEMAWSEKGAQWGDILVCENVITGVEQYSYRRRVTFLCRGVYLQFTATMGHDGDHEYETPYPVRPITVVTDRYEKVDDGKQADRPAGPAALPPGGRSA